ncbi:optic morphology(2D), isoform A [Drosophila ananassae]|uniref:Optic morphology(2D), isoform A n=2 Tax=Drosophila ananassae TaxID=7217 RepID=B3M6Y4_DROAN|nr:protein Teyrha-meyrha isoform X1 [Drosophila ananassae]EDV40849.1 optic morphology(2D), isoform A [Drosophila ananassae]
MESNAFGSSHLPSQALVVLSEAASGLHEALRGQRPFPARLPDAKDLHNMSLVGNYFNQHLLINHGMLVANGAAAAAAAAGAGPASYFASDRSPLGKPSVLSNFSLPSAFSPPKYIGISLDQNLFNGSESFRTDSASPTCTSHESMEGSQDYDAVEKGESPRSNNSQDPRDLRHLHSAGKSHQALATSSSASSSSSSSCSTSNPAISTAASSVAVSMASHLAAASPHSHAHSHHPHNPHSHPHPLAHPHAHPHHGHHVGAPPPVSTAVTTHHHMAHPHPLSHHHAAHHAALASLSMAGLRAVPGGLSLVSGLQAAAAGGAIPDLCPVCGLKLSAEEWHTHFLTELDRLYKLSAGFERANLQATYMFAPPCPAQENAIRTSHNRWETFQRIRNNRQNRLRLKVRKRKYGEMYMMESLYCSSCPICKRKYALETGKIPPEDDAKSQEEIETVDVESCNDDVPDSGSELTGAGSVGSGSILPPSSMHNSNAQPGKLDGILYRTACVMNQKDAHADEQDVSTNVTTASSSSWPGEANAPPQAHISVKTVSELSSTTHHYYNADSCGVGVNDNNSSSSTNNSNNNTASGGGGSNNKELMMDTASCQNDSDEDVIVDDDDTVKVSSKINYSKVQRRQEEQNVGSSRSLENISPVEERPRSEPQVSSTEPGPMDIAHNNNNNNNNSSNNNNNPSSKYAESMENNLSQLSSMGVPGLTQLDTKVGISSDLKPDDENKCFICKTGIKDLSTDAFLRGRNFYFHQSCANVMSSYRLNKELLSQAQSQQRAVAGGGSAEAVTATATPRSLSPAQSPQQSVPQAME